MLLLDKSGFKWIFNCNKYQSKAAIQKKTKKAVSRLLNWTKFSGSE